MVQIEAPRIHKILVSAPVPLELILTGLGLGLGGLGFGTGLDKREIKDREGIIGD